MQADDGEANLPVAAGIVAGEQGSARRATSQRARSNAASGHERASVARGEPQREGTRRPVIDSADAADRGEFLGVGLIFLVEQIVAVKAEREMLAVSSQTIRASASQ